jgi:nucleosome binding factor SPN SPT16 subunit
MVFIYKDYTNWKRISSIPIEQLDSIKDWLDESDVYFSEGPASLVWPTVLQAVRSDIGQFLKDGGWTFLSVDGQNSDDSEPDGDSDFDEED